jgi:hypothetical protein
MRKLKPAARAANQRKVQDALSRLCGTTAHLACYTSPAPRRLSGEEFPWRYSPASVLNDLDVVKEIILQTIADEGGKL